MKRNQKSNESHGLSKVVCMGLLATAFSVASIGHSKASNESYMKKSPSKQEWQYFLKSSAEFKQRLWVSSKRESKSSFRPWSWQWRLGWLRACSKLNTTWCKEIDQLAVSDKATVVRSEAVRLLFEKKKQYTENEFLKLVEKAYFHKGNNRNGKALYIKRRIFYLLHAENRPAADNLLQKIAKKDKIIKAYAGKLYKIRKF